MNIDYSYLEQWFRSSPNGPQVFTTVVMIVSLYLVYRILRFYIGKLVTDILMRQQYWAISRNTHLVLGLILVGGVWLEELKTVSLVLSGFAVAIMIGSKEVFLGLIGRINLAATDEFEVGDRIMINGICGDVINIGLLNTWMFEIRGSMGERQSTGRVVIIPNLWLTMHAVINFTHRHDFQWDEIEMTFPLTIDVPQVMDWITQEAMDYLKEEMALASRTVLELTRAYAVKLPPMSPITYSNLERTANGEHTMLLTLRYVNRTRSHRSTRSELSQRLVTMFQARHLPLMGSGILPPDEGDSPAQGEEAPGSPSKRAARQVGD